MKCFLLTILILLFSSVSYSAEIAFFNIDVFGKNAFDKINLLEELSEKTTTLIQPKLIQVDIEKGVYSASSIYYSADEVDVKELVTAIDKKYPNSRNEKLCTNTYWAWRVENKGFVISFGSDVQEGMYRVCYIKMRDLTAKEMSKIIKKIF